MSVIKQYKLERMYQRGLITFDEYLCIVGLYYFDKIMNKLGIKL